MIFHWAYTCNPSSWELVGLHKCETSWVYKDKLQESYPEKPAQIYQLIH